MNQFAYSPPRDPLATVSGVDQLVKQKPWTILPSKYKFVPWYE